MPGGVDGAGEDGWVVLDYLDCVLHVFTTEARERYQLEELWHEAPRLELDLTHRKRPRSPALDLPLTFAVRARPYGAAHG